MGRIARFWRLHLPPVGGGSNPVSHAGDLRQHAAVFLPPVLFLFMPETDLFQNFLIPQTGVIQERRPAFSGVLSRPGTEYHLADVMEQTAAQRGAAGQIVCCVYCVHLAHWDHRPFCLRFE